MKGKKLPMWASVLIVIAALVLDWLGLVEFGDEDLTVPVSTVDDAPLSGSADHLLGGVPSGSGLTRLNRTGYVVGYSESRGSPAWVAYHLVGGPRYENGDRPGFSTDTDTQVQVSKSDYTNSGYDRGHMAPNYAIATRYGAQAQKETFLMSNIIPQTPELNQRTWRMLEEDVAGEGGMAERLGEVWVVTGPVFGSRSKQLNGKVDVPSGCYKIIVDETDSGYRALAFLFPQEPGDDAQPEDFLTTIDAIEGETGLDFFSGLLGEASLESSRASALW